ncbi:MAG TPA: sigma-70 family RNA polymerase sigma factor [Solirubrobacteraceae bacterium]
MTSREDRFQALYADARVDVLRFVQRRVHPSHAEDVVADAFLVVWRRLDDAPARHGDLRAWLFGIARNCLLNALRGQGRGEALAVRLAEAVPAPDGFDPELVALRIDLAAAWRTLSAGEQEVLALAVFEQLDSTRAARVLGITAVAYRLRLMRARRALRRQLEHPHPQPTLTAVEEAA